MAVKRRRKRYPCKKCDRTFGGPQGLASHMKAFHSVAGLAGKRVPALCNGCEATFASRQSRGQHWRNDVACHSRHQHWAYRDTAASPNPNPSLSSDAVQAPLSDMDIARQANRTLQRIIVDQQQRIRTLDDTVLELVQGLQT